MMDEIEIFAAAIALANPIERAALVDRECAQRPQLRARIELLLKAHEQAHSLLDAPLAAPSPSGGPSPMAGNGTNVFTPSRSYVGDVLAGRYKLLEEIGEGGMGTVWMAEQREPVKRLVAVKLIKAGMDSKSVLARFEAERQALALMDHPHIAKVLDGGATDEGRPYFVMELVKGLPLTDYCDARKLSIEDRLKLFTQICSAVQHAHQKAVIHRDLKPSNILVTEYDGKPVPKVIDFGLAKALHAHNLLTDRTLHTAFGTAVGTPLYMAPEQVGINALDVDTRTDIYALGAILYELLTGSTPLEKKRFREAAWDEVGRLIREEEPPIPSKRVSTSEQRPTLSANRDSEPLKLTRILRGELDWIVMKALEKDRSRRYETANGLSLDVQRYITGEPVLAAPPSSAYRMQKFIRRHRPQVIAASLLLATLILGILGTAIGLAQARHAAHAERLAKVEAYQQKSLALKAVDQERIAKLEADGKRKEAERNLAFAKKGNEILGKVFAGLDAEVKYETIGDFRTALKDQISRAVKELDEAAVPDLLERAGMQQTLAKTLLSLGDNQQAKALFEKVVAARKQVLGADHPDTLTAMDWVAEATGYANLDEAFALFEHVLTRRKAILGPDHLDTLESMNDLAVGYWAKKQEDKAIELYLETLPRLEKAAGRNHHLTLLTMDNLGVGYFSIGKLDQALEIFREVHRRLETEYGSDDPRTLHCVSNLAACLEKMGKLASIKGLTEESLKLSKEKLGPNHPQTLDFMLWEAKLQFSQGKVDSALVMAEEALRRSREHLGFDHERSLSIVGYLAWAYPRKSKFEKAIALNEESMRLYEQKWGRTNGHTLGRAFDLAVAFGHVGRVTEAIPLLEEVYRFRLTQFGSRHADTDSCKEELRKLYIASGRADEPGALNHDWQKEIIPPLEQKLGSSHIDRLAAEQALAVELRSAGKQELALRLYQDVFQRRKATLGPLDPRTLVSMKQLAETYIQLNQPEKAQALTK